MGVFAVITVNSLLDIIVSGFFRVVEELERPLPLSVFGFDISVWHLIITLFICGTIINILVGESE